MNSLLLKRNYPYIIFFVVLLLGSIVFGSTRIISYNFGTYSTELTLTKDNIENTQDLFDETIIHDVQLSLTSEEYGELLSFYKAYEDKLYIKTQVVIDGVSIPDVGVKLKGSSVLIGDIDETQVTQADFSFVLKFDEYNVTQTYLGKSEIALISGTLDELKGEYIAGKMFEKYDVMSPKVSFATVISSDFINTTYLLKEVVDEEFIQENYADSNGLVYKAENSFSFTYLGEDPTAYTDLFTQKTLEYNYDLKKLIDILEFVSNTSNQNFVANFQKYIDIENYTKYLAINNILYGENDKIALLNSYYLYYDIVTETIQFIPWDSEYSQNIETTSSYQILKKIYSIAEIAELGKNDYRELLGKITGTLPDNLKTKYTNDLEKNFLKQDTFESLYNEVETRIQTDLDESSFVNTLETQISNLVLR